jgi:hypothetical protein
MAYNQEQNRLFTCIPKTAGGSCAGALASGNQSHEPTWPRKNRIKMSSLPGHGSLEQNYSERLKRLKIPESPLPHAHRKAGRKAKDYRLFYTPRVKKKLAPLFKVDIDHILSTGFSKSPVKP